MSDLTGDVAEHVHARPCVYERRVRRPGEHATQWELADRRPFAEGRKRARAYVRSRLGDGVSAGSTSAGVEGRLWAEVVRGADRLARPEARAKKRTEITPEAVEEYNVRRGTTLGVRVGQVCGMQGGRMHEKRLRAEGEKGGPASSSETIGCIACKLERDRQRRAMPPPARRANRKQRAWDEWAEEDGEAKRARPSLRHWLTGQCVATQPLWRSEKSEAYARQLEAAHKACKRAREEGTRHEGAEPTRMLEMAAKAARAVHRGEAIDAAAWSNRYAVLAGCLPAWADDEHASASASGTHTKETTSAVMHGQEIAAEAAEALRKAAAPGQTWLRHRNAERGLMTLVFRCWRERVEHDAPGINNDPSRWQVRKTRRRRAGPRRSTRRPHAASSDDSEERKFAADQLAKFGNEFAEAYTWSPWREGGARETTEGDEGDAGACAGGVDEEQLRRWRLKCDLKRVATYYRVTGAQERAEARGRGARTRARFRAWADSVRRQRAMTAQGAGGGGAGTSGGAGAKRSRGCTCRPGFSATCATCDGAGGYSETRPYKQRATQDEMVSRRLRPRRRKLGPTAACTELGKRLRDNMGVVADRCIRQRRAPFGDG